MEDAEVQAAVPVGDGEEAQQTDTLLAVDSGAAQDHQAPHSSWTARSPAATACWRSSRVR